MMQNQGAQPLHTAPVLEQWPNFHCVLAKQMRMFLQYLQNLGVFNKQIFICTELRLDKVRSLLFCPLRVVNKDPNS